MFPKGLTVVLAVLLGVGVLAGPLAAEEWSTGQEWEWEQLECREDQQYPETQDEPTGDQCAATHSGEWDEEEQGGPQTYEGRQWDNQVRCHEGLAPDAEGIIVGADGDPDAMRGGAGVCNDGDTVPVRGRVVVGGSEEHGGLYAYADGDERNAEPADGWVRADVTADEQNAGCGASEGKRDATAGDPYEVGNCGGPDDGSNDVLSDVEEAIEDIIDIDDIDEIEVPDDLLPIDPVEFIFTFACWGNLDDVGAAITGLVGADCVRDLLP